MSAHGLYASALAVVGAVGISSSVLAADLPSKAPVYKAPVAIAPSWTGFYAGINGGYGWDPGSFDLSDSGSIFSFFYSTIALPSNAIPASNKSNAKGFIGGIQGGYNYQIGQTVLGLETDFQYSGIRGSTTSVGTTPGAGGVTITTVEEKKLEWLGTLRGRLGILATPSVLTYVTGGLAYGKVSASNISTVPETFVTGGCSGVFGGNVFCNSGSTSGWRAGWTLGGGAEAILWGKWSAKAEYIYYDLGRATYTDVTTISTPGTAVMQSSVKFDGHIVRLGLNYKFN